MKNARTSVALAIAAVGIVGLAGCATGSAQADQMPQRLVTPSPTQIDPKEQAIAAAQSTVDQWNQVNASMTDPGSVLPVVDQYLVGEALASAKEQFSSLIKEGATFSGPRNIVSVKQIGEVHLEDRKTKNGEWGGPEIRFRICVDVSKAVKHMGGKSFPLDNPSNPYVLQTNYVYGFGDVPESRSWKIGQLVDQEMAAKCD